MNLYNLLSEKDLQMLDDYRLELMGGKTEEPQADLEYVLRRWNENKQPLFQLLDNNLIYKVPVEFNCEIIDQETAYNIGYNLGSWMYDFCERYYPGEGEPLGVIENLFSPMCLKTNKVILPVNRETFTFDPIQSNSKNGLRIRQDSKVTKTILKILKFFEQQTGEAPKQEYVDDFLRSYSTIKSFTHLEGNLCFSIHPLDYLTMSDNEANWKSCLSLRNKGDYCSGAIEMMNHENILIVYIESTNSKMKIGENEWNNKIWRELFYVDFQFVVNIKSYPLISEEITTTALEEFAKLANKQEDINYVNQGFSLVNSVIEGGEKSVTNRWINICFSRMYNDFDTAQTHHHLWLNSYYSPPYHYLSEYYDATCLWCGESLGDQDPNEVFCAECKEELYCEHCGCQLDINTAIPYKNNTCLCSDCFDEAVKLA